MYDVGPYSNSGMCWVSNVLLKNNVGTSKSKDMCVVIGARSNVTISILLLSCKNTRLKNLMESPMVVNSPMLTWVQRQYFPML
jgi:hypothetical protein